MSLASTWGATGDLVTRVPDLVTGRGGRTALSALGLALLVGAVSATPASALRVPPGGGTDNGETLTQRGQRAQDATRDAPFIVHAAPTGEGVAQDTTIVVTFSQPMSRSSVEDSFITSPPADGAASWPNDSTFRFQPLRLLHGITYEARVVGRSASGIRLRGPYVWRFTVVPGPPLVLAPGPVSVRVPILMYHYIRVNPDPRDQMGYRLSVTPRDFAAQMDWLARNGYHPITFHDLSEFLGGVSGLPSRPIILTFDDGYADFYTTALPVLISHDFNAVAYVVSGFVGSPGYMTAAQVRAADRAGIEIGSHTVNHVDLTRQSAEGIHYELVASRASLEGVLGHPVLSFCYPSGKFNASIVAAVQAAGYRDATTTRLGSDRSLGNRYTWGRIRIAGGESLSWFAADVLSAS